MPKSLSMKEMPDKIPVFPLPGALLLPRGHLPLNIFEPKYLAMLEDVLKNSGRLLGMIQPMQTPKAINKSHLHQIGCVGRVVSFTETSDGRYQITLRGISRFRIIETVEGFTPYICAKVNWDSFEADFANPKPDHEFDRNRFINLLGKFFTANKLASDMETLQNANEELLVNSLSMLCPFSPEEKQALLEAPDLKSRRETLTMLMEMALQGSTSSGQIQ